ncbi:MAG: hypothetical protein ACRELG_23835 [Gemmataceae bacterium]
MHWLQRLKPIDAPEHTSLYSAELNWRGLFPIGLAALFALVLGETVLAWFRGCAW